MSSRPAHAPRPCFRCLAVKEAEDFDWGDGARGRGVYRRRKGVCRECEASAALERQARADARKATWTKGGRRVRRCSKCRAVKGLERGFYVTLRRADGTVQYSYHCKPCSVRRVTETAKRRLADDAGARAKRAAAQREYRLRNAEKYRQWRLTYNARVRADPERYAQLLEAQRMAYRLRRERAGADLDAMVVGKSAVMPRRRGDGARVPAAPLLAAIEAHANRSGLSLESVAGHVGITDRTLRRWRGVAGATAQAVLVDRVLTVLELNPQDVWDA